MKIAERYLGTTVLTTSLLVLLMLTVVTIFITLIQEISDIGSGNYGFLAALEYVFLELPQQVYSFFPMAVLVGVSLGLGLLANHSELTVLRANGMSLGQISWAVIKAALLLLILATVIGEWIGPIAERVAENQKTFQTSKGQALQTSTGTWIRDGHNFLYINTISGTTQLAGINRYEFDNQENLVSASYAAKGTYQKDGSWLMHNIVITYITLQGVHTAQLATATWPLSINPKLLKISTVDPTEMTLKQLYDYILYLRYNKLSSSSYELSFWQRVLQPLASLVMVWLAIPFVFGPLRSLSIGLRIMAGIALGFLFYILNEFFGPLSIVYSLPPFLSALIPTVVFALLAYFLQKQVR